MILIISIIVLTIAVFGLSLLKWKKPILAFLIAGVFTVLSTTAMVVGGNEVLNRADNIEGRTEVSLTNVDDNNNYVIYDTVKGVYYYKEKTGDILKEVNAKNVRVSEEKQGKATNTVVRQRVSSSNVLLRTIYQGSPFESKVIVEFKIEDGGLTIQ